MTSSEPTVLHVVEAVEAGVLRHVVDVVSGVPARHHVALPSVRRGGRTDHELIDRLPVAGAQTHPLELTRSPLTRSNLAAARRLRRLVRQLEPDVVHVHSSIAGAVGRLAVRGLGVPVVYTPNGVPPMRAARVVERLLGPLAQRIVAVSKSEARLILDLRWCRPERLSTIPNGIPVEPLAPVEPGLRAALGLAPETLLIGAIGRLTDQKAPELVIEAWGRALAERPDTAAVWLGDGDLRDAAQEAADRWGGGRIHLLGHVPDAAAALGELDVFCLGSRFEGGPYALLEAMRAGVAVVATDVVGSRDAVEHGVTGMLVPFGDVAALSDALLGLLDDPGLREALGSAGRAAQRERFSSTATSAALLDLYRSLCR